MDKIELFLPHVHYQYVCFPINPMLFRPHCCSHLDKFPISNSFLFHLGFGQALTSTHWATTAVLRLSRCVTRSFEVIDACASLHSEIKERQSGSGQLRQHLLYELGASSHLYVWQVIRCNLFLPGFKTESLFMFVHVHVWIFRWIE